MNQETSLVCLETRRLVWNSAEILLTGAIGVREPGNERTRRPHRSGHGEVKRRGVALCKRNTPEWKPSAKWRARSAVSQMVSMGVL